MAARYGLSVFEWAASNGKKYVIVDHQVDAGVPADTYCAENMTTQQGEITLGPWIKIEYPVGARLADPSGVSNPHYVSLLGKCFRCDGVSENMAISENGFAEALGIDAPSSIPVVSSSTQTGGEVSLGTYLVYFAYRESATDRKSNPSTGVAVTVATGGNSIKVKVFQSLDRRVDEIEIYRPLVGGGTVYYEALSVPNETAEHYLLLSDDNIRGNEEMSFDNVKPPPANFVLSANNRLFLFDSTYGRCFFSEPGNPFKFSSTSYTSDFDRLDGEPLTGVALLRNTIIVFKRNRIYSIDLYGDFAVTILETGDGCVNYRTIAVDPDGGFIIFLSPTGVKMISTAGKKDLTLNKIWYSDLNPRLLELSDPSKCFAMYSPMTGCYHLYFSGDTDDPSSAAHYVCSLRDSGSPDGAWTKWDHKYNLFPSDAGTKFYSFGILTDNFGFPYLCSPVNGGSGSSPVQLAMCEDSSMISVPYYIFTDSLVHSDTLEFEPHLACRIDASGAIFGVKNLRYDNYVDASFWAAGETLVYIPRWSLLEPEEPVADPSWGRVLQRKRSRGVIYEEGSEQYIKSLAVPWIRSGFVFNDRVNSVIYVASHEDMDLNGSIWAYAITPTAMTRVTILNEESILDLIGPEIYSSSVMSTLNDNWGSGDQIDLSKNWDNYYSTNPTDVAFLRDVFQPNSTGDDWDGGIYADSSYWYVKNFIYVLRVPYDTAVQYEYTLRYFLKKCTLRISRSTGVHEFITTIPAAAQPFKKVGANYGREFVYSNETPAISTFGIAANYPKTVSGTENLTDRFYTTCPVSASVMDYLDLIFSWPNAYMNDYPGYCDPDNPNPTPAEYLAYLEASGFAGKLEFKDPLTEDDGLEGGARGSFLSFSESVQGDDINNLVAKGPLLVKSMDDVCDENGVVTGKREVFGITYDGELFSDFRIQYGNFANQPDLFVVNWTEPTMPY